jgi:[acyl-carrier-protein] S-malonyltransferase
MECIMKQTAVIVAPGRGTYNKTELGYLLRFHQNKSEMLDAFDDLRQLRNQKKLSELDGVSSYSNSVHTRGDNASALIYACGLSDFLSIDKDRFEILAVTGNSMGWYTALACAGALDQLGGLTIANTMGSLMQEHLIGGQIIYPYVDEDWQMISGKREDILTKASEINAMPEHVLALSIDLGGMIVLAGNETGLKAFERIMPITQERFPLRLTNHAGFHTHLQIPVSKKGKLELDRSLFRQADIPLIDGRGYIWHPNANTLDALYEYTLGHQVIEPYHFNTAIKTAALEFMPDVFIILGPGTTLSGATAQSLIAAKWHGWEDKRDFVARQAKHPDLLVLGNETHRSMVIS